MTNDTPEGTSGSPEENPGGISLSASYTFDVAISEVGITIVRAEKIRIEDSPNLKYLSLRNGDLYLPQKVIVTFDDGQEAEITADVPPGETLDF